MTSELQYAIGMTVFYGDGKTDTVTVNYKGTDAESARNAAWHEYKNALSGEVTLATTLLGLTLPGMDSPPLPSPLINRAVPPCKVQNVT